MTAVDRPRLRPLDVLRQALAIYRVHWWRLILAALAVFGPLALADGGLEALDPHTALGHTAAGLAQSATHVVGDVFYAGLVAAAVIAWRSDEAQHGPLAVARSLKWGTIAALDLIIPLGTAIGLLLLIVPGVAFYVYFSLAPAIVKIDRVGVRASMRLSARAVRGSFWRVLFVLALIVVVTGVAEQAVQSAIDGFVGHALANLAIELATAPFFGLVTVIMAFELHAEPSERPAAH